MLPIKGEDKKPKIWNGLSLKGFGESPFGQNLWRVVWGPSRLHIVGGMWEDRNSKSDLTYIRRAAEYRWIPKYRAAWILERWLPAMDYAGTPLQWKSQQWDKEAKCLTLGPYPTMGEYEECYAFPEEPTSSMVIKIIQMLVFGSQYTPAERKQALEAEAQGKEWDWENKCEAIFRDSQGAFNNLPSNVNPAKRTADQVDLPLSAEDVGMPSAEGKFFQR